jgi:hypothetical protein
LTVEGVEISRHCEERSDEAIQRRGVERFPERLRVRAPLDCFAALAMTVEGTLLARAGAGECSDKAVLKQ